jgi:hypothetical protein
MSDQGDYWGLPWPAPVSGQFEPKEKLLLLFESPQVRENLKKLEGRVSTG